MKTFKSVRGIAVAAVVAAAALSAFAGSASAGSLLVNTNCGTVSAHGTCHSANFISGGQTVYARFTLVNGPGVNHCAYVFSSSGGACSSNQYTYSKCVSSSGSGIYWYASGLNNSTSGHAYTLQLYRKTSSSDPCTP